MTHKTIYLKSSTKTALIADIAQLFEGFDASNPNFWNDTISGYWIGKIPNTIDPETGAVLTWKTGWHANLSVPVDFDTSIFATLGPTPTNPVHGFDYE